MQKKYTCILVFTTSSGVFPKTLAAPAVAPNIAVTMGCISFLGSSPLWQSQLRLGDGKSAGTK